MAIPKRTGGLGRGLGDLIRPTGEDADAAGEASVMTVVPAPDGSYFAELDVHDIRPNPRQPRTVFDPDELGELVDSIKEVGLLQPVVVRPLTDYRMFLYAALLLLMIRFQPGGLLGEHSFARKCLLGLRGGKAR